MASLCAVAFGLAFIASSLFRDGALVGLGIVMVLAGAAYRTRAAHNYWLTCRLDPSRASVGVEPTHPDFDRAASELFVRSLHR